MFASVGTPTVVNIMTGAVEANISLPAVSDRSTRAAPFRGRAGLIRGHHFQDVP
jgi:hypothetical protein